MDNAEIFACRREREHDMASVIAENAASHPTLENVTQWALDLYTECDRTDRIPLDTDEADKMVRALAEQYGYAYEDVVALICQWSSEGGRLFW